MSALMALGIQTVWNAEWRLMSRRVAISVVVLVCNKWLLVELAVLRAKGEAFCMVLQAQAADPVTACLRSTIYIYIYL